MSEKENIPFQIGFTDGDFTLVPFVIDLEEELVSLYDLLAKKMKSIDEESFNKTFVSRDEFIELAKNHKKFLRILHGKHFTLRRVGFDFNSYPEIKIEYDIEFSFGYPNPNSLNVKISLLREEWEDDDTEDEYEPTMNMVIHYRNYRYNWLKPKQMCIYFVGKDIHINNENIINRITSKEYATDF